MLEDLARRGLIEWSSTGNPRKIIYADEYMEKKTKRQDVWEFKDPPYPSYPTEKNIDMLKVIIDASSNKGDIVLDCFSGSGTSLIAAEELERKWIGIDNSPLAIKSSVTRLVGKTETKPFTLYSCAETNLPESIQEILNQRERE